MNKSQRYKKILYAFCSGMFLPFFNKDLNKVRKRIESRLTPIYKGFAYEGAAFGIAFIAGFKKGNQGKRFETMVKRMSHTSIYQHYVAFGWYMNFRYGFNPSKYNRIIKQLDKNLGIILFDGVGFKSGFFRCNKNKEIIEKFEAFEQVEHRRVCYQGFGRSLWFTYSFDIDLVIAEIDKLPTQYREDTYSGLGLANAYSFFDQIEYIFSIYHRIPIIYQAAFTQGLAFGFEARRLQDSIYWESIISNISIDYQDQILKWISIVHIIDQELTLENKDNFYIEWIDRVRISLKSFKNAKLH